MGTTSLDFINDLVKPDTKPAVYQRNDFAKSALKDGPGGDEGLWWGC
ncbi:hypothetical protein SCALM49S_08362 [Streptomyces californicus]